MGSFGLTLTTMGIGLGTGISLLWAAGHAARDGLSRFIQREIGHLDSEIIAAMEPYRVPNFLAQNGTWRFQGTRLQREMVVLRHFKGAAILQTSGYLFMGIAFFILMDQLIEQVIEQNVSRPSMSP